MKNLQLFLLSLFNICLLQAMGNPSLENPQGMQLRLNGRDKVTLSYPLFFDWVRNNVVAPSSQESEFNIGVFDEQGKEVAQLVGNESFVWDVKGIEGNPYVLISCSCSLEGNKGKVISWNLATRKPIAAYELDKNTFLLSVLGYKNRSGQYIIAAAGGTTSPLLYLINALTGDLITKCTGNHTKSLFSLYKNNGENWFATIQLGGQKICIWDFEGNNLATINASDEFIHRYSPVMALFTTEILGSFVVSHNDQQLITFWRQQDNFAQYAQCSWNDLVTAFRVTEDSKYLATGGLSGTLTLWKLNQVADCEQVAQCTGHSSKINNLQFLNAKKLLISASGNDDESQPKDISVRVWDFNGNQLACVQPSSIVNELEYIQLTEQNEFVVGSSGGDLFFFSLVTQPQDIGDEMSESYVNDERRKTKQLSPHQRVLQLLNNSEKNNL